MPSQPARPAASRSARRLPRRVRSLAAAAALAVAAWGLPALPAHALDNGPTDPGVRCAAKVGPGQYEFYLPGEKATDVNGNKWVCGPDGQWFRDYSTLTTAPTSPTGPRASQLTTVAVASARLQR
jgi:hypothetical protein